MIRIRADKRKEECKAAKQRRHERWATRKRPEEESRTWRGEVPVCAERARRRPSLQICRDSRGETVEMKRMQCEFGAKEKQQREANEKKRLEREDEETPMMNHPPRVQQRSLATGIYGEAEEGREEERNERK